MLRNKGVGEFVEAARLLRGENPNARFRLVGLPDPQNPTSLTDDELAAWQDDSAIEWLGPRSDIAAVMKDHHIVVLPSYREGLPKVLLEAMATGRPIVATDVPGCREAVADGDNGLLVPPRDAQALAGAIGRLMADPDLRIRMGRSGRQRAETEFATGIIVAQTLALYTDLVARPA
jgi:glycosyltransferase involved in cell wall biosynthesis